MVFVGFRGPEEFRTLQDAYESFTPDAILVPVPLHDASYDSTNLMGSICFRVRQALSACLLAVRTLSECSTTITITLR